MSKLTEPTLVFLLGAIGVATAADEPLLDYRDQAFLTGTAFYSDAERRSVAAALETAPRDISEALGEAFVILGDADGAFTAPGVNERIYLVQGSAPVAIDPFPKGPAPLLVAMKGGAPTGFFGLPGDVQYQRLVAAADGDGDGRDEVLLETAFMNMGQSVSALDVISLSQTGTASVAETLEDVYVDSCENPAGERMRSASTVSVTARGFRIERFTEACPE